jgi:hypothetical protein
MSLRDREVLDLLSNELELLAIADAVADTQHAPRPLRPFYKEALANGDARIVGQGEWDGMPVYWVDLAKGGGLILRVGIGRDSYRPVVFRALNPDGSFAGFQVGVLGFDYVSKGQANFDTAASLLVSGRVVGRDCRLVKARVGAFLGEEGANESSAEVASARTGANGSFTLEADPRKSPFREALARNGGRVRVELYAVAGRDAPKLIGFTRFSRTAKGGRWVEGAPVTIQASRARASRAVKDEPRRASLQPGRARPSLVALRSGVTRANRPQRSRKARRVPANRAS